MFIVVLLMLLAFAVIFAIAVLAVGALVGGCLGAAFGGTLPLIFGLPAAGKGHAAPNVLDQVVRHTLGIVGGGLLGGIGGLLIAGLALWVLLAMK